MPHQRRLDVLRFRTMWKIRRATDEGGSCSQTRMTRQPALFSAASWRRSRSTLALSFRSHHSRFALGIVPCWGHLCQKQPSTKMAILSVTKTMSGLTLGTPLMGRSTRKRSPSRCRAERTASSAGVSRCSVARIRRLTAGELATGADALDESPLCASPLSPRSFIALPECIETRQVQCLGPTCSYGERVVMLLGRRPEQSRCQVIPSRAQKKLGASGRSRAGRPPIPHCAASVTARGRPGPSALNAAA